VDNILTFLDSIPEETIAATVYLLGSLIVLACWYGIAIRLPKFIGGLSWIVVFAVLLTPTVSDGSNASIAPAFFGVVFGVLTKDSPLIWTNLALITFVIGLGLILGFLWTKFSTNKSEIESNKKSSPL
jgi:preprotein translocase subunit SecG